MSRANAAVLPALFLLFVLGLFGGMTPYTPLRVLSVVLAFGVVVMTTIIIVILIYVIQRGARRA